MKYLLTLAIAATLFSCKQKVEETKAPESTATADTLAVPTLTQKVGNRYHSQNAGICGF